MDAAAKGKAKERAAGEERAGGRVLTIRPIAVIHTDLPEKFGIPRQSGLVDTLRGRVVFEEEYRVPEALRGIEGFSHLWLIWGFHRARQEGWSPTVRPPRLGGNIRLGDRKSVV